MKVYFLTTYTMINIIIKIAREFESKFHKLGCLGVGHQRRKLSEKTVCFQDVDELN